MAPILEIEKHPAVGKVLITGASGYIGMRLAEVARTAGFDVISLSRRQGDFDASRWIEYDLTRAHVPALPADVGALVHLAISSQLLTDDDARQEIDSALRLLEAARNVAARFIFVSSQTARAAAPTLYGRTKWAIEQHVLAAGGWVVRPGQVYGGPEKGLFGILVGLVRRLPALPAFLPSPKIQPVHVDDLSHALLSLAIDERIPPAIFCVASIEPVAFTQFLSLIARERLRTPRFFFPVPVIVVRAMARVMGARLAAKTGLGRLLSLFALPLMDTARDLSALGVQLRPLHAGLRETVIGGHAVVRRELLIEAGVLLTYIMKRPPGIALRCRYVRVIEKFCAGRPLNLPRFMQAFPVALALLDDRKYAASAAGQQFMWRVEAATVLAEATPAGASRFLGLDEPHGVLRYALMLVQAGARELFWRVASALWLPQYLRSLSIEESH